MPHTLGDFELSIISDGTYYLDGGAFFGVVPKVLWERRVTPDEKNRITTGLNSLLIRTGDKNVLIETGIGNKLNEKQRGIHGNQAKLLDNFAAAGIDPADIDIVINSHLHFDHCGWNTIRQDDKIVPTFPNAKYYAQAGEYEHGLLQLERDRVSYLDDNYGPLIRSGQMTLLHGDSEILPGIKTRIYRGHTANMQAVLIESQGKTACFTGDLVPTTAHLDPTWAMAFDLYPLDTIESRKRLYAEAIPNHWLLIFTHDHNTPMAYVEKNEEGKLKAIPQIG
jgi:glyoxylase-like metal-dependent hydrolase (beta-lactamase superfamily II)